MREITVFQGDDWRGLYINGDLVFEGHSIPIFTLLQAAVGCTGSSRYTVDGAWLEAEGGFPRYVFDIPSEVRTLQESFRR